MTSLSVSVHDISSAIVRVHEGDKSCPAYSVVELMTSGGAVKLFFIGDCSINGKALRIAEIINEKEEVQ